MRSYIFTKSERKRLETWIKDGSEDDTTRMIFVSMRHNFQGLLSDIELMRVVMYKLRHKDRWVGRSFMPKGLGRKIKQARSVAKNR